MVMKKDGRRWIARRADYDQGRDRRDMRGRRKPTKKTRIF